MTYIPTISSVQNAVTGGDSPLDEYARRVITVAAMVCAQCIAENRIAGAGFGNPYTSDEITTARRAAENAGGEIFIARDSVKHDINAQVLLLLTKEIAKFHIHL